jgi:hypothetical protein
MDIIILPSLNGGKNIDVAPGGRKNLKHAREKMMKAKIDAREITPPAQESNRTTQEKPTSSNIPLVLSL